MAPTESIEGNDVGQSGCWCRPLPMGLVHLATTPWSASPVGIPGAERRETPGLPERMRPMASCGVSRETKSAVRAVAPREVFQKGSEASEAGGWLLSMQSCGAESGESCGPTLCSSPHEYDSSAGTAARVLTWPEVFVQSCVLLAAGAVCPKYPSDIPQICQHMPKIWPNFPKFQSKFRASQGSSTTE